MITTFQASTALAAVLPLHPHWTQGVEFLFSGFVVVMIVLIAMMAVMYGLGIVFGGKSKKAAEAKSAAVKKAAPVVRSAVPAPAAAVAATGNQALIVVLAAAAHVALGQSAKIISVNPVTSEWSTQGRRDIFSSHKIR